jgi:polyisoprenoid-binding protein YceI
VRAARGFGVGTALAVLGGHGHFEHTDRALRGCSVMTAETCLRGAAALTFGLAAFVPRVCPAAARPPWHIERGEVKIEVPLKPGGAFEARTSSLTGSLTAGAARPLPLVGDLTVELATIDTGIGLRNRHLREKYLEVGKGPGFDKAIFSEIRVNDAEGEDFQGHTGFTGTLLLHGTRKVVAGAAEIRRSGSGVRVEATFPLTLTDFGIVPPEYLGVGVANRVLVKVSLTATRGGSAAE